MTSSVTRGKWINDFEILIIFGGFWSTKSEWRFKSISLKAKLNGWRHASQSSPRTCTVLGAHWSAAKRAVDYSKTALSKARPPLTSPKQQREIESGLAKHWKWWKRHFLSKLEKTRTKSYLERDIRRKSKTTESEIERKKLSNKSFLGSMRKKKRFAKK